MEQSCAFDRKSNRICSVPECSNYARNGISLHTFPVDVAMRRKWSILCKIGEKLPKGAVVCSEHFDDSCFFPRAGVSARRRLKIGSLPSLKLPIRPSYTVIFSPSKEKYVLRRERAARRRLVAESSDNVEGDIGQGKSLASTSNESKPADFEDVNNVDWLPSLSLGYNLEEARKAKLKSYAKREEVVEEHSYTKFGPFFYPENIDSATTDDIDSANIDDIDSSNIDDQVSPDIDLMGKTPTQLSFNQYISILKTFVHPPDEPERDETRFNTNPSVRVNYNELMRKEPINGSKDNSETESDFEMVGNSGSPDDDSQCLLSRKDDVRYSELTKENERLRIELESTKQDLDKLKEKYSKCQDLLSSIVKDEKGISVVLLRVDH